MTIAPRDSGFNMTLNQEFLNQYPIGTYGSTYTGPSLSAGPGEKRDAILRLTQLLESYGLGNLTNWITGKLVGGASETEVTIELYQQPEFKARFPAIEERRKNGFNPISPVEILAYEDQAKELFKAAGITSSELTSNVNIQRLISNNVSAVELQGRLQNGLLKVTQAPPEVKAAFNSYFGTNGESAMAQLFLDPTTAMPELEKMAQTAYAGGIGKKFNIEIAKGIAREIVDTGASEQSIWQGFNQINAMSSVFQESISENVDLTAENQGIGAVFGTNTEAEKILQRRVESRTSQFKGGGGIGATEQGVIGLGVAGN